MHIFFDVEAPKRIEWLHSVPALIAISLGLVYGIGAISIYGQLNAAHLNAVQTMGIIPLDQILSRGIGKMVSQFGQAVVMVGLMALIVWMTYGPLSGAGTKPSPKQRTQSKGKVWDVVERFYSSPWWMLCIVALVLALSLAGIAMREALVYVISITIGSAAFVATWKFTRRRNEYGARRMTTIYAITGLVFLVSFNVAAAFLRPTPLPHIRLSLLDGREIEGGLVTESDGSWYVVQENHSIAAVYARKASRSFITYPSRSAEQSLVDWLWDRPPSNLLGGPRDE